MASATEQIVRLHFDRLLKQHDSSVCDELLWTDPHDHEADPQREQGTRVDEDLSRRFAQCAPIVYTRAARYYSQRL